MIDIFGLGNDLLFLGFLLLNKGRGESGASKLPKMCGFGLKIDFFSEKDKNSSLEKLDIGGSILDTFRGCENIQDLAF